MQNHQEFWDECLRRLQEQLPEQQLRTWIKPLSLLGMKEVDADNTKITLGAPNLMKLNWVRSQFAGQLNGLCRDVLQTSVELEFVLSPALNKAHIEKTSASTPPTQNKSNPAQLEVEVREFSPFDSLSRSEKRSSSPYERSHLNAELTFASFVTGKANQLAHAAALQVAENPGVGYNPLFLYGSTGLGKTHLIHAIGNSLFEKYPNARVRYVHSNQYANHVVKAYQRKSFDEFKADYHSLDLLLIDDIQFLANKTRTQEEFFYAFEALVIAKKQIIITSDTYPKELTDIEERLKSRFESGLTVAIEPPELEMRVAILIKKAEQEDRLLSEDVAFFIGKHLRSNVRELEGALRKVLAYSAFHGREITVELAREALRDLLAVRSGQVTIENIQKTVADFYKIKVADMHSKRRPNNIALPRQIAMYLAKELTQKSLPEIGESFGGRDHTTVLHAVRKINKERQTHQEMNHALHVLEQTLKS